MTTPRVSPTLIDDLQKAADALNNICPGCKDFDHPLHQRAARLHAAAARLREALDHWNGAGNGDRTHWSVLYELNAGPADTQREATRLDPATVEACAKVADEMAGPGIRSAAEVESLKWCAARIRSLVPLSAPPEAPRCGTCGGRGQVFVGKPAPLVVEMSALTEPCPDCTRPHPEER